MDEAQKLRSYLERTGSICCDGHFVLSGGCCSDTKIEKTNLFSFPTYTKEVCTDLARKVYKNIGTDVDCVVAPTMGAVLMLQHVGVELSLLQTGQALTFFAEKAKKKGEFGLRSEFARKLGGKKVLVLEDVITTGGSTCGVIEVVRKFKGDVVGVAALVNRGNITKDGLAVPYFTELLDMSEELTMWPTHECAHCNPL